VLFAPNAALAEDMADTPVQFLSWTNSDSMTFTGRFFPALGRQGRPAPLFIVYYRCTGFLRGSVGDEWPLSTFAENGIAALCINAGDAGLDQDIALVRYANGLTAVESAVAMLAAKGEIDPARVGMGGLSFGSEVTMWTAMHSNVLRATSLSTPVISPNFHLLMSLGEETHFNRMRKYWQVGELEQTAEGWRNLTPTSYLDKIQAASLMQMSEQEYRLSLDYTIPLIRKHRADVYVFPDEPHQKFQPRHKLAVYLRNLDWFRFWLQDYEDPAPSKIDQYEVWRRIRAGIDGNR